MADELARLAGFLYETGLLKRYRRSGWSIVGVKDPESIAEHSFRTAVIGTTVACLEEADPQRTAVLCLFHDTQETRLTDLPHIAKRYVTTVSNGEVTTDQTRDLPGAIAGLIQGIVTEYEEESSLEAVCAHDADKLECLIQACEYREHGYRNTEGWIETCLAALRTPSAKRLAHEVLNMSSLEWHHRYLNGE